MQLKWWEWIFFRFPWLLLILAIGAVLGSHGNTVHASYNPISGLDVITFGNCPAGLTEDTTARGFYLVGIPSGGTNGATLGSAMSGSTPPDVSYTPAGTNASTTLAVTGTKMTTSGSGTAAVTTVGGITVSTASQNATIAAETFTGTASNRRSAEAPAIYARLCKIP